MLNEDSKKPEIKVEEGEDNGKKKGEGD